MVYYFVDLLCIYFLMMVIRRFFHIFFVMYYENKLLYKGIWAGWVIISFAAETIIPIPIVKFLILNIFLFLVLLLYEGKISKKVLITFLVTIMAAVCDLLSYVVLAPHVSTEHLYAISYVFMVMLLWGIESLIEQFLRQKETDSSLEPFQNNLLLIIPFGTLGVLYCITQAGVYGKYLAYACIGLLIICVMSFYMYHVETTNYMQKARQTLLENQIYSYQSEIGRIEKMEKKVDGLRHDMHYHFVEIESLIDKGDMDNLRLYIQAMDKEVQINKFVSSGKFEIDSLINYLLEEAEDTIKDISVNINLPSDINVDKFKLNVILGNLLENAIDAASKADKPYLFAKVFDKDGALFIEITNTYKGPIDIVDGKIETNKKDKENHGLGITNVERLIREVGGDLKIEVTDKLFSVKAMTYL